MESKVRQLSERVDFLTGLLVHRDSGIAVTKEAHMLPAPESVTDQSYSDHLERIKGSVLLTMCYEAGDPLVPIKPLGNRTTGFMLGSHNLPYIVLCGERCSPWRQMLMLPYLIQRQDTSSPVDAFIPPVLECNAGSRKAICESTVAIVALQPGQVPGTLNNYDGYAQLILLLAHGHPRIRLVLHQDMNPLRWDSAMDEDVDDCHTSHSLRERQAEAITIIETLTALFPRSVQRFNTVDEMMAICFVEHEHSTLSSGAICTDLGDRKRAGLKLDELEIKTDLGRAMIASYHYCIDSSLASRQDSKRYISHLKMLAATLDKAGSSSNNDINMSYFLTQIY